MNNYEEMQKSFPNTLMMRDYPMARHTTFKVGGNCDLAVFPKTINEMKAIINYSKGRYPYCVIGKGSNVLVSDKGFRGVCIFTENLIKVTLNGNILVAECGAKMKDVLTLSTENNLSGLEFTVGIPGSVGGMVAMNAGCFNKSVSDVVCYVKTENAVYNNKTCNFNYRTSRFLEGEIILSVAFKLKVSEDDLIKQKLERFSQARRKAQPSGRSVGSVFINQGYFAGKVIDKAGLKGKRLGGAYVSEKHANFIIADGDSATDIYELIKLIKQTVSATQGIDLIEEVRYIGEF